MEEDILNYSPTVVFRGTPCIIDNFFLQFSRWGVMQYIVNWTLDL